MVSPATTLRTHIRFPIYSPLGWWSRLSRYPLLAIGLLLALLVLPALFANWIAPQDPIAGQLSARLKPPFWMEGGSTQHLLGADKQGRDILTRIIYGARISLQVSLVAVLIGGSIGTFLAG